VQELAGIGRIPDATGKAESVNKKWYGRIAARPDFDSKQPF
jgi:hypothetical protein